MKKNKKKINERILLDLRDGQCPFPMESVAILAKGEDNPNFKILSKKITDTEVKLVYKHKQGNRCKIVFSREFLDLHKIPYKEHVFPTNKQIFGVLNKEVDGWSIKTIITDLSEQYALVVLVCEQSNKVLGCKVPVEEIQQAKEYIKHCRTISQAVAFNCHSIEKWREVEWQREVQTKINLLQLTHSTTLPKA